MNQQNQAAFTIIELLIVIVVIAILAAITIVPTMALPKKLTLRLFRVIYRMATLH